MSLEDKMCFVTLLCLASSADEGGLIRDCDEDELITLSGIYADPREEEDSYTRAKGCLKRYNALQIVTLGDNGDVTVVAFAKRQGENLSNAERQKNYRERLKITKKKSNTSDVTRYNDSNARIEENRIDIIGETKVSPSKKNMSFKNMRRYKGEEGGYEEVAIQVDPDHKPKGKKQVKKMPDDVQAVFDLFSNPAKVTWRMRELERVSAKALFDTYGLETLEKRINRIESEKKKNADDPFFPLVTSPSQLLDKMEAVERYLKI